MLGAPSDGEEMLFTVKSSILLSLPRRCDVREYAFLSFGSSSVTVLETGGDATESLASPATSRPGLSLGRSFGTKSLSLFVGELFCGEASDEVRTVSRTTDGTSIPVFDALVEGRSIARVLTTRAERAALVWSIALLLVL